MTAAVLAPIRGLLLAVMITTASVVALAVYIATSEAQVDPTSTARRVARDRQILRADLGVLLTMKTLGLVDEGRIAQWIDELTFGRRPCCSHSWRSPWRSQR